VISGRQASARRAALLLLLPAAAAVWSLTPQHSGTASDLRGVSAPGRGVVWASGTKGTFLRSTDSGATWSAAQIKGAEELDFRDVEAFDAQNAVLLAAGEGPRSRLYKTQDGGASWTMTFQNPDPKGFFDALAFWDRGRGLALGDPVDGRFALFATQDSGSSWKRIGPDGIPPALPGEGAFAASGTCLVAGPSGRAWFGTGGGGGSARVFRSEDGGQSWKAAPTSLPADTPSSGVFSLAFWDALHGVAVGGDYKKPGGPAAGIARTEDGGASWVAVATPPPLDRFLSAVVVVPGTDPPLLVATGPEVSAFSKDGGRSWVAGEGGFNALAFEGPGAGWAVGPAGRIGRFPAVVSAGSRR
jgi:photosystem II stability/assembly factor-like uncharacterized protein